MPFQELIRAGSVQGLLVGDWAAWRRYRDIRARTSHAYSARVAEEIVRNIPAFPTEAVFLRDALRCRLE